MPEKSTKKEFDLEKRTLAFAKSVLRLCRTLKDSVSNRELIKQVVRSSCSVGANYREANEALGRKDFHYKIKISRKECKETTYWLDLIEDNNGFVEGLDACRGESVELRNIFSAILRKSK